MPEDASSTSDVLRAISNPRRLAIVTWLADPEAHFPAQRDGDLVDDGVCVGFITKKMGISQPAVTEHMQLLAEAGLVSSKKIKNWVFYKLQTQHLSEVLSGLQELVSAAAAKRGNVIPTREAFTAGSFVRADSLSTTQITSPGDRMSSQSNYDAWSAGQSYEHYMGRWSRMVAAEFLNWLDPPMSADWLEIGCGTGALTSAILRECAPKSVLATDASEDFVGHARQTIEDPRSSFKAATAQNLPAEDKSVDIVTSALVLNFVPDRHEALIEMQRVLGPGGILSFYVWDYPGGGIGFIDAFWKAAASLDPKAADLDEGTRFPFCTAEGLAAMCSGAGLADAKIAPIEIVTEFPDFEAFWHPFTLGAGPAPGYCMSLSDDHRDALKTRLAEHLDQDGPVRLTARAWAMKATVGG